MKSILFFSDENIKMYRHLTDAGYRCVMPQGGWLNLSAITGAYVKENEIDVIFQNALHLRSQQGPVGEYYRNMQFFLAAQRMSCQVQKVLYFGSGKEFDTRLPINDIAEEDFGRAVPVGESALSKYTMNLIARQSGNLYNLRLFSLLEEGNMWDRNILNNLCCRAVFDLPLVIDTDGDYDYLYIEDLNKILEWFIENSPAYHDYNLCPGNPLPLSVLAQIVKDVTGNSKAITITNKAVLSSAYYGSGKRLAAELGGLRYTPIREAIENLCHYYDTHRELIDYSVLVQP